MGKQLLIAHGSARWLPLRLSRKEDLPAAAHIETLTLPEVVVSMNFEDLTALGIARLRVRMSDGTARSIDRKERLERKPTTTSSAIEETGVLSQTSAFAVDVDGDGRND